MICGSGIKNARYLMGILCGAVILTALPISTVQAKANQEVKPAYSLMQVVETLSQEFSGEIQSIELKQSEGSGSTYVAYVLEGGQRFQVTFGESGINIMPLGATSVTTSNVLSNESINVERAATEKTILDSGRDALNQGRNILSNVGNLLTSRITEERAREIALAETGGGVVTKSELNRENGIMVYEIDIVNGDMAYEINVGVNDSKIYKNKSRMVTSVSKGINMNDANVISAERAKEIAIQRARGGVVEECKLKTHRGVLVYEIELINNGVEYEVRIDATTGAITEFEID